MTTTASTTTTTMTTTTSTVADEVKEDNNVVKRAGVKRGSDCTQRVYSKGDGDEHRREWYPRRGLRSDGDRGCKRHNANVSTPNKKFRSAKKNVQAEDDKV